MPSFRTRRGAAGLDAAGYRLKTSAPPQLHRPGKAAAGEPTVGPIRVERSRAYRATKRALDVACAALGLVFLAPLFLIVAVAIRINDGQSVFFVQRRVGKGGRLFNFYKFRSMTANADRLHRELAAENDHGDSLTFKMRRDPRITRVGRILRRTSIDELPQLWNVLKGDMSLVGPRPALPAEVERYSAEDWKRLAVTPGLTCIWQISGRAHLPFDQQVKLDIQYIQSQSLWLDVRILARTVPAVLTGFGAF